MAQVSIKNHAVSDIKSKILRPAQTSIYTVQFSLPSADKTGFDNFIKGRLGYVPSSFDIYDKVSLLCNEASLPGSTLSTHEINNDYTGVTERHAYRRLYDDRIDFTFYVDAQEYFIIRLIDSWISYATVEYQQSTQGVPGIQDISYNYRVNFPKNYYTESLTVTKFEKHFGTKGQGSSYLKYNFVHAYPISINSIPVSYDQSDLLRCTVSFNYTRYWIQPYNVGTLPERQTANPTTPQPSNDVNIFNQSSLNNLPKVITNEYYNNGIIRGNTPAIQFQGPGQRSQDATNFGRGIA